MIEEILVLVCFSLAGAISALTLWKHSDRKVALRKPRRTQAVKPLNATRSEIEALQFEKSILSHSITNIYEAVQNGKIGAIERDRLLLKYKSQLDAFNKKIGELQLSIDLTELSEMRTQLVCLLEERIASIEGRLTEISKKSGIPIDSLVHATKRKYTTLETHGHVDSEIGEKKREAKREAALVTAEDRNIQEVQQEIMQALTSLEHAGEVENDMVTQGPVYQKPYAFTENIAISSSEIKVDGVSHPDNKSRDALSFLNEAELEG
ncbi:MAG: hypothetical protein WAM14_12540 [Candidatus Nitrosopolaris sp.]